MIDDAHPFRQLCKTALQRHWLVHTSQQIKTSNTSFKARLATACSADTNCRAPTRERRTHLGQHTNLLVAERLADPRAQLALLAQRRSEQLRE